MGEPVPPRDLRNHYGDLLRRVQAGEEVRIVRDGATIALLTPPRAAGTSRERLREIFSGTGAIDRERFFADLYDAVDAGLHDPWEKR